MSDMALHRYQNQNAFSVGIRIRTTTRDLRWIVPPSGIVELENDATKTRCFNPATGVLVPLSTMTDLGLATPALSAVDDDSTWPIVP